MTRNGFSSRGASRRTDLTWILLAINVLLWVTTELAGGSQDPRVLLTFGAMFGPFIADGEYWRLFTAMFLHVGWVHLALNGLGLIIFGRLVEQVYGHVRFAIIYLLSGLTGSVASYLLNSISIGAGASGAIFGVLAALAAYFVARRDLLGESGRQNLTGILVLAAINLVFGLLNSGIDNWAHIGGFAGGFAVGLGLVPRNRMQTTLPNLDYRSVRTNPFTRRLLLVPLIMTVIVVGTWLGTTTLVDDPTLHIQEAERHIERQNYEQALSEIERALEQDNSIGEAYYLRGRVMAELGEVRRAQADLSKAIKIGLGPRTKKDALALLIELNLQQ